MAGCCVASGAATGTCTAVAAIGAACSESTNACAFCDPDTAACLGAACVALGTEGSSCDQKTTPGCARGFYCTWEKAASTCLKTLAEGAACDFSQSGQCSQGLNCLDSTRTCQPRDRKSGESCVYGQYCLGDGQCLDGVCKDPPAKTYGDVGASCMGGCKLFLT